MYFMVSQVSFLASPIKADFRKIRAGVKVVGCVRTCTSTYLASDSFLVLALPTSAIGGTLYDNRNSVHC